MRNTQAKRARANRSWTPSPREPWTREITHAPCARAGRMFGPPHPRTCCDWLACTEGLHWMSQERLSGKFRKYVVTFSSLALAWND
eukprot:711474-Pyramimonas_sp.AAC.1